MVTRIIFYSLFGIVLFILSCSTYQSQNGQNINQIKEGLKNPLIFKFNETIDFENIDENDIRQATDIILWEADRVLEEILAVPDSIRTFENTLLRLDDLYNIVSKVWNSLEFLSSVSDKEAIRHSSNEGSLKIQEYLVELSANEPLYNSILLYSHTDQVQYLPINRKRFLESELRDFRHSGCGLNSVKRNELKNIQNRISELGMYFTNNVNAYTDTIFLPEKLMGGLSIDYKDERYMGNGIYAIDLSYPSFYTFMENAESDSIRQLLRYKFLNKGMRDNLKILDEILALRNKSADILGYSSFAAFTIEEAMANTPEAVWKFENDLENKIQEKANWDTRQLLEIKRRITDNNAEEVHDWEKYYYENKILQSKYNVDIDEVRQYFKVDNVINGFFTISQRLFGIEYRKVEKPSVWHSDVIMYEMLDSATGDLMGRFYLDLYPREYKYQHAAEFTIISGKKVGDDYQLPVACLVCNFPKASTNKPSLLSHDDVETFFHEFGHLIHDLLSKTELSSQSGTNVAMDFVEAPSQMLENWAWNREALKIFAKHFQTGDIIPDSLLNRMLDARNLQSGNALLQQIFYGVLDITLHENFNPAENESSNDVFIKLQNNITHYAHIPGTNQLASFDHLIDYSASYYGYLWSEVYAADMFSIFEEKGVFDSKSGRKFRTLILERGDSENPMNLVENFLLRKPNNNAFLKRQGIAGKSIELSN